MATTTTIDAFFGTLIHAFWNWKMLPLLLVVASVRYHERIWRYIKTKVQRA